MSCAVFPPCHAVRPGLVVAIAEAVDDYTAPDQPPNPTQQVPIRMRLRKLIYGHSPGQEFTLQWFAEVSLRAGELIYIEESNAPLRARACGQTDRVSANTATRQKFFQELAAGKHQGTYVRIAFRTAAHSAIRLTGPNGTIEKIFDARGVTEWRNLPPGRYTVHPARSGFTLDERNESNPVFQLLPGACVQFLFDPK